MGTDGGWYLGEFKSESIAYIRRASLEARPGFAQDLSLTSRERGNASGSLGSSRRCTVRHVDGCRSKDFR